MTTLYSPQPVEVIPDGSAIDGAVAELSMRPDGTITAEIRIPGPPVP